MKKYNFNPKTGTPYIAQDIAQEVVELLNDEEYECITDAILDNMDSALIYYKAQWEVLMEYCLPETADLHFASLLLYEDIENCIEEIEEEE